MDKLGLSVRTSNALRRQKIDTLEKLMMTSVADLAKVRNFGEKSIKEVMIFQEQYRKKVYDLKDEEVYILK